MNNCKTVIKEAQVGGNTSRPTDDELKLINAYTRRELKADEVYVFSVVLCDNDVDRDNERFTVESLFELEKLFVGKTGIFDHDPSARNQTARIFACSVESAGEKKTATGDDYFCLKARAYIPVSQDTAGVITAIDSGIIKEVSVGCSVGKTVCSICGEDINFCSHKKGEIYNGRLCCGELREPSDAYEWSFVAVPSQRQAGVTKSAKRKEITMEEILKRFEKTGAVTLGDNERAKLRDYIDNLKVSAKDGVYYRDSLTSEVVRLSAAVQPEISRDTMECITKTLSVVQLNELKTAFENKLGEGFMPKPQLFGTKNKKNSESNREFSI